MMAIAPAPLVAPLPVAALPAAGQGVQSPTLRRVETGGTTPAGLWQAVRRSGTPLIEPVPARPDRMTVTFLWRGAADARTPRVFGVFNDQPWNDGDALTHLPGTDIWYRSYALSSDLRATYMFLGPRGTLPPSLFRRTWVADRPYDLFLDPANPRTVADVYFRRRTRENIVAGPRVPVAPWVEGAAAGPANARDPSARLPAPSRTPNIPRHDAAIGKAPAFTDKHHHGEKNNKAAIRPDARARPGGRASDHGGRSCANCGAALVGERFDRRRQILATL